MRWLKSKWTTRSLGHALHGAGVAVTIGLIGCASYVFLATDKVICELKKRQQQDAVLLGHAAALAQQFKQCDNEHRALQAMVAKLRSYFPATANETEVLTWIGGLCQRAGVELQDFRPGATTDLKTHRECELQFTCAGPFAQACRFLDGLQKLPYGYRVAQLNITAPTARGENCKLDVQVQLQFGLREPP